MGSCDCLFPRLKPTVIPVQCDEAGPYCRRHWWSASYITPGSIVGKSKSCFAGSSLRQRPQPLLKWSRSYSQVRWKEYGKQFYLSEGKGKLQVVEELFWHFDRITNAMDKRRSYCFNTHVLWIMLGSWFIFLLKRRILAKRSRNLQASNK